MVERTGLEIAGITLKQPGVIGLAEAGEPLLGFDAKRRMAGDPVERDQLEIDDCCDYPGDDQPVGRALLGPFRISQALAVLEPAANACADLGGDQSAIALLSQPARAYMLNQEAERAVEAADRALAAAERADLVGLVADTLVSKGSAMGNIGRGYQSEALIVGGMQLAQLHGLTAVVLRAQLNLGAALFESNPNIALETGRAGFLESSRLGQRHRGMVFLLNAAEAGVTVGDWDWALPELEDQLSGDVEPEDRVIMLSPLIQIRGWRGEPVDELVDELERLAASTSDPSSLYSVAYVRGLRGFAQGALDDAADRFRDASRLSAGNAPSCFVLAARCSLLTRNANAAAADLQAFQAAGTHGPFVALRTTEIRAGLAALDGRPVDSLALYAELFQRCRDLGLQLDEAFGAIEMATLLDPALPEVARAGEVAREILVRLGAAPFIERLDAALVATPVPRPAQRATPVDRPITAYGPPG